MSSTNHGDFKDQAHELRERIKREQSGDGHTSIDPKESLVEKNSENELQDSVTLLNLPPRSVVHSQSNKGVKLKIKFPLVRLLLLIFLVILLSIPLYHMWNSKYEKSDTPSSSSDTKVGEMVSFQPVADFDDKTANDKKENTEAEKETPVIEEMEEVDNNPSSEDKDELTLVSKEALTQNQDQGQDQNQDQDQNQVQKVDEDPSPIYYQVKKGDTLFSIAMEFYGAKWGETLIIEANRLDRREVFAGETLLIPEQ